MRYCNRCRRLTTGEPLYCNYCGSSYNVKLCPARHLNPRTAEVCSQCGSRDLSTPAPPMPFWLAPLLFLLSLVPGGVLMLLLVILLLGIANAILTDRQVQTQLLVLVLLLALLTRIYLYVPGFIKNLFRTLWRKSRTDRRPR